MSQYSAPYKLPHVKTLKVYCHQEARPGSFLASDMGFRNLGQYTIVCPGSKSVLAMAFTTESSAKFASSTYKMAFSMTTMSPAIAARPGISARPSLRPAHQRLAPVRANPFVGQTNDPEKVAAPQTLNCTCIVAPLCIGCDIGLTVAQQDGIPGCALNPLADSAV